MEYIEDCKTLVSQIKQQDKELRLKRRWLMDLELTRMEAKRMKHLIPQKDKFVPESLIREDDVYYENIRACIEKGFLAGYFQKEKYDNQYEVEKKADEGENYVQLFNSRNGLKDIFSMLDEMTNKGLWCFAEIVTGGLINFEKTNRQMKKLIKECLPVVLKNQKYNHRQQTILQLSELLRDPKHFRGNYVAHSTPSKSYRAAAKRVLSELQGLPFQTLSSMHRKVRGVNGYIPQMQPPKSGWGRGVLTKQVRKRCIELLSELGEADEPQKPLSNALAVAGLTLKLKATSSPIIEFRKFSPETEALQNEIMKAIQLVDDKKKVSFTELKDLLLLLDPNAKFTKRIRMAMRNLLIEYLLECADMETIPECFLEVLTIINKRAKTLSCGSFSKEELEKEVECVLAVSAQTKQIIWDLLSECGHAFDQEFANAYMEDMLESDDGTSSDDDQQGVNLTKNCRFHSDEPNDQIESIGETNPVDPESPISASKEGGSSSLRSPYRRLNIKNEDIHITEMDSVGSPGFFYSSSVTELKPFDSTMHTRRDQYVVGSMGKFKTSDLDPQKLTAEQIRSSLPFSPDGRSNELGGREALSGSAKTLKFTFSDVLCGESRFTDDKRNMARNEYLAVQEACDKTSMVAYHFVGRMLNELAQVEGLKLYQDDISYLRGEDSGASKRQTSSEDDVHGALFFRVLEELSEEELMHSFPASSREKLKELMGIK